MSDEKFTKIAAGLLTNVRDLVDWGVDGGHTTTDRLRLTVEARKEAVAKLHKQGLSQRGIASVVGAHQATVSRDLSDANGSKSDTNASAKLVHESSECDEPYWHTDPKVRWISSLLTAAEKSVEMPGRFDEEYPGWRNFNADRMVISTVRNAVKTWQSIATTLEEKLHG
jgi:IS30 family transposase